MSMPAEPGAALTPRELELLRHIAAGDTDQDAALAMGVTVNTARGHRWRVLQKLGARTSAHAVALAMRAGVLR